MDKKTVEIDEPFFTPLLSLNDARLASAPRGWAHNE
jgi:hypothetical protein